MKCDADDLRRQVRQMAEALAGLMSDLLSERETTERLLALRTRQNTQASEAWAKAAEKALAGDPRALHDRLRLHRESLATNARVVQSAGEKRGGGDAA